MLIIVGNVEARKMLENAAESHQSSARGVSPCFLFQLPFSNAIFQLLNSQKQMRQELAKPALALGKEVHHYRQLCNETRNTKTPQVASQLQMLFPLSKRGQ